MVLNTEQQQAVTSRNGPTIIKAGPGTGKTRTLTARIEHLIFTEKVQSSHILALTFTRKAAAEMKGRLSHLHKLPTVTTFHAFAYDILKQSGHEFEIISERDKNDIIHTIIEKSKGKEVTKKNVKELSLEISNYKNTWTPDDIHTSWEIIEQYDNRLKLRNLVDYDDLILILYRELKQKNEHVLNVIKTITHVLVDEFQDTNRLQYEIIKLCSDNKNLFVIGDPYQSIYGFRGADATIFKQITKDFPEAVEITLQDNYRSAKEIVQASSALFPEMGSLQSRNPAIGTIQIVTTCDEYTEGKYVLDVINKKVGGTDLLKTEQVENTAIRFSDIAVIYRSHHIGRTLQQLFLDSGIPFQIVGEDSPYDKPAAAFISNCIAYSIKKNDETLRSLFYSSILNVPSKLLRALSHIQSDTNVGYREAVELAREKEDVGVKEKRQLSTISKKLKEVITAIKNVTLLESIHIICERYNIEHSIDLQQYIACALQYDTNGGMQAFVSYLAYLEEHDFYDPRAEKVALMTMHASKGLEFNTVCICGFEEGVIPSKRINTVIEEEKRLLYVAMTRAKEHLYLLYPQMRMKEKHAISSFYSYVSTLLMVRNIVDDAIEKRKKKVKKMADKKSQLSLF